MSGATPTYLGEHVGWLAPRSAACLPRREGEGGMKSFAEKIFLLFFYLLPT